MTEDEAGSKKMNPPAIETSLTAVSRKLSGSAQLRHGSILIRLTDSGEEYSIEMTGREARMARAAPTTAPLLEVSVSSTVLKEIMDGRKEASSAFLAGGIQVRGDVPYLEALLKELGLLHNK